MTTMTTAQCSTCTSPLAADVERWSAPGRIGMYCPDCARHLPGAATVTDLIERYQLSNRTAEQSRQETLDYWAQFPGDDEAAAQDMSAIAAEIADEATHHGPPDLTRRADTGTYPTRKETKSTLSDPPSTDVVRILPAVAVTVRARPTPTDPSAVIVANLSRAWLTGQQSANTRDAYARDLTTFLDWAQSLGLRPLDARRPHLDAYARHLATTGYAPSTRARALAALASFYTYAEDAGVTDRNPTSAVKRPKTTEGHYRPTPAADPADVTRVLTVATDPADRALMLTLCTLGLRISEALALDVTDLGTTGRYRTLTVRGKGERLDTVTVPTQAAQALDSAIGNRTTGPIFTMRTRPRTRSDRPTPEPATVRMSRQAAQTTLNRLARLAGAPILRPHSLRVTAITETLNHGATLRDVQDYARHGDPRTTRRYDRDRNNLDRHNVIAQSLADRLARA